MKTVETILRNELDKLVEIHSLGTYYSMCDIRKSALLSYHTQLAINAIIVMCLIIMVMYNDPILMLLELIPNTPKHFILAKTMEVLFLLLSMVVARFYFKTECDEFIVRETNGIRSTFGVITPELASAHETAIKYLSNAGIEMESWSGRHTVSIGELQDFIDIYKKII